MRNGNTNYIYSDGVRIINIMKEESIMMRPLRRLLEKKKRTEVARETGLSVYTVSRFMRGKKICQENELRLISTYLPESLNDYLKSLKLVKK